MKNKKEKIDKRFWFVLLFSFLILAVNDFYPTEENNLFQELLLAGFLMAILPLIFIKTVLKENLEKYGFTFSIERKRVIIFFEGLILALLLFIGIIKIFFIQYNYGNLPVIPVKNFLSFLFAEIAVAFSSLLIVEIFFRGFLQSFLEQYFSSWKAIFFQSVYFFLVFYYWEANHLLNWPTFSLIFVAPFAGWIKWKSQSWIYSWFLVWLFLILSDAVMIYLK